MLVMMMMMTLFTWSTAIRTHSGTTRLAGRVSGVCVVVVVGRACRVCSFASVCHDTVRGVVYVAS